MNLILFVHQDASRQGEVLQKKLVEYFGENIIQLVHTFNSLTYILKQPGAATRKNMSCWPNTPSIKGTVLPDRSA